MLIQGSCPLICPNIRAANILCGCEHYFDRPFLPRYCLYFGMDICGSTTEVGTFKAGETHRNSRIEKAPDLLGRQVLILLMATALASAVHNVLYDAVVPRASVYRPETRST